MISVQRRHGLGNVLQLLPVLRTKAATGVSVELVTRPEWVGAMARLAPELSVTSQGRVYTLDLDAVTVDSRSTLNRTEEFMQLLDVPELHQLPVSVPDEWAARWEHVSGATVVAPEAAFPARQCPPALASSIGEALRDRFVVVVGRETVPPIACRVDLRAMTAFEDLIAIVAGARNVVCMDSAILHLAALFGVPTVALFGGISPESRTHPDQHLAILVGGVLCRPCNKNETCGGAYHCLHRIRAEQVVVALNSLQERTTRSITIV